MRVLQIITTLGIGGAENLAVEFALRMRRKGIVVDIISLNKTNSFYEEELERNGINVIYLSQGRLKNVYNPLHVFKIARYIKNYDIVHVHLFPAQYWAMFAKLITFSKTPFVTTEHNTTNRRWNNILFKYVDRWVYSGYSRIVSISQKTQSIICRYLDSNDNRFFTIENGIDLDKIKNAQPYQKADIVKDGENYKFIVNVAGFREQKDQDTLIKALNFLPDNYHLLLVGDGERKSQLIKLVSKEKQEERVHFLGRRNDVPRLLKTADIVAMSSHWEGMSLSSIEGMASGKPFMASDVNGLNEIVDGFGILFRHSDEKDFAEKVVLLENDDEYRDNVIKKCMEKSSIYDINNTVENYIKLYKSLI